MSHETIRLRRVPTGFEVVDGKRQRVDVVRAPTEALVNASRLGEEEDHFPYSGPVLARLQQVPAEYPVIIPAYAQWFDLDVVHATEKEAFPELVKTDQDAAKYKEVRDFIVKAFRANPRVHLTATACRKLLAADACTVLRIHRFLENWGVINHLVDPGSLPAMAGRMNGTDTKFPLVVETPHSGTTRLDNLIHVPEQDDVLRRSVILGSQWKGYSVPGLTEGAPATCSQCPSKAMKSYYRTYQDKVQGKDLFLCTVCFHKGNFPEELSSDDFSLVHNNAKTEVDMDGWTQEENGLLLDAIEKYGESWEEVAQVVSTRSKAECVAHFVRLPIEDPFLEQEHNTLGKKPVSRLPVLFNDASNPILAQIGFLSSLVSPAIAAAAAKSALTELSKQKEVSNGDADMKDGSSNRVDVASVAGESNDGSALEMSKETLERISTECVVSAAAKADELSQREFKQIVTAVVELVQLQMKKVEIKMKHYETMDLLLTREKEHLDKCREALSEERVKLTQVRKEYEEKYGTGQE